MRILYEEVHNCYTQNIHSRGIKYFSLKSNFLSLNNKKNFHPNYFVDISKFIKKKINALKIYKSEIRKYPHSRSLKNVRALAQVRGTSCGRNYAEAFVVSRIIK